MTELDTLITSTLELVDQAACSRHPHPDWWVGDIPIARGRGLPHDGAIQALRICKRCPVRGRCFDIAMDTSSQTFDHGIWGGTTPGDRNRIRRGELDATQAMDRGDAYADMDTTIEAEPWLNQATQ